MRKITWAPFNAFTIKIMACLFMLTDHIGWLLLPEGTAWRMIGRLAFPLFAFMIANGWRHSRDRGKYFLRLAVCALVIQWPYLFFTDAVGLNIFFTLALGLAAIWLWERLKTHDTLAGRLAVLLVAVAAELIGADYGCYGVLLILTAHIFYGRNWRLFAAWLILNVAVLINVVLDHYLTHGSAQAGILPYVQPLSLLALLIIAGYNGRAGKKAGWLFYVFYPLHLAVLYLIGRYL
ncbi:MAG: conjugal transfer protein TraX [Clostridiales bacterium]|nr:conjugal transfer protein TraX [Clostridiales bacterium]